MAMPLAAAKGHLEIIQWLHANTSIECTASTPVLAAEGGQLDVLKWLHANMIELEWSSSVMDAASTLPALEWLRANRIEGYTTRAMDKAIADCDFDRLLFLRKQYPRVECSTDVASSGVMRGHVEMFFWLCANCHDKVDLDRLLPNPCVI